MTDSDPDGLVARIRRVSRLAASRERSKGNPEDPRTDPMRSLQARVAHLEQQLEGLQDSVHRESDRHAKMIADLQAQVQPAAMSAALADDARTRGL